MMFREMRRKKQQLSYDECAAVLHRQTSGVLAVSGDDEYPYAVPLSYVYAGSKIFFHGARTGHKLDGIARNEKVSFCVIDLDNVAPEKYTTLFRSVIVFGKARVLEDEAEKIHAIEILTAKYSPDHEQDRLRAIDRGFDQVCMIELSIDHMTGKEAAELRNGRPDH
jgi:nitroimidazol reductase NimA-like FMN-containing flavoprotein (pyridoxamine 5'-phosphate oxidase superfamily)